MENPVEIQVISPTETLILRREVLRPERPLRESVFAGDDDIATQHWGGFVNHQLVAVASIYQEPMPENATELDNRETLESGSSWRLRGMAVNPDFQGQGYGRRLLDRCLDSVNNHEGRLLWCNARASAVGFYQGAGFEIVSREFIIPDIGPHYVMLKAVG